MSKDRSYDMMLDLLKADHDFVALEDWAKEYGLTLQGRRFQDQWRFAVQVAINRANEDRFTGRS